MSVKLKKIKIAQIIRKVLAILCLLFSLLFVLKKNEYSSYYEGIFSKKDSDNDILFDIEEVFNYETDPNNLDTDGDGVDDYREVLQGTIKIKDADNDLLPDKVEREITKTDPNNPDTDGDGVRDGIEIKIEIINYKKSRGSSLDHIPQEWLEEYEKYKDLNK